MQADVPAGMQPAHKPLGFVALLGVIALVGMMLRNSVILVDQIETEITHGRSKWSAVIEAASHRFRPILLTAAAAIFGMIPIAPTVFLGALGLHRHGRARRCDCADVGISRGVVCSLVWRCRGHCPGLERILGMAIVSAAVGGELWVTQPRVTDTSRGSETATDTR